MPSKQQPNQTRLACPRGTHDGDLAARLDVQANVLENRLSGRVDGDAVESHSHTASFLAEQVPRSDTVCDKRGDWFSFFCRSFLRCAERLQQPQQQIAMHGVLLGDQCDLLSQNRKVEGPVSKEKSSPCVG